MSKQAVPGAPEPRRNNMKYLQTLSLLVMAAASLMVFVSSASAASVLTSPAGTHFTGSLLLTLTPGSSTQL
ncbi:MAG: hypothetical protein ACTHNY_09505, partial [Solirubrobacterales bacterium]